MKINVSDIKDELRIDFKEGDEVQKKVYYYYTLALRFDNMSTMLGTNQLLEAALRLYLHKDSRFLFDTLTKTYENFEIFPLKKDIISFYLNRDLRINIDSKEIHQKICLSGRDDKIVMESVVEVPVTYFTDKIRQWFSEYRSQHGEELEMSIHYENANIFGPSNYLSFRTCINEEDLTAKDIETKIKKRKEKMWEPLMAAIEFVKNNE